MFAKVWAIVELFAPQSNFSELGETVQEALPDLPVCDLVFHRPDVTDATRTEMAEIHFACIPQMWITFERPNNLWRKRWTNADFIGPMEGKEANLSRDTQCLLRMGVSPPRRRRLITPKELGAIYEHALLLAIAIGAFVWDGRVLTDAFNVWLVNLPPERLPEDPDLWP